MNLEQYEKVLKTPGYRQINREANPGGPGRVLAGDFTSRSVSSEILGGRAAKRGPSPGELALRRQIDERGLPTPVFEFQAIPERAYRFDVAFPEQRLLVEVQGGVWRAPSANGGRGAHSSGAGITRDCEKASLAVSLGWAVMAVTTEQVTKKHAIDWIELALRRRGWDPETQERLVS